MASRSWKSSIFAVALLLLGIGTVVLYVQHSLQTRQRREHVASCRQLKQGITTFKTETLDSRIAEMRQLRLNDLQSKTLSQADQVAYMKFASQYQQKVDGVAEAVQEFSRLVDEFQKRNCLDHLNG
jgi:transcriptional regulator NrdR family protein